MINQKKLYWDVRDFEIQKMADILGLSHTGLGQKLKDPTEKLYVDEFIAICETLHPKQKLIKTLEYYLT